MLKSFLPKGFHLFSPWFQILVLASFYGLGGLLMAAFQSAFQNSWDLSDTTIYFLLGAWTIASYAFSYLAGSRPAQVSLEASGLRLDNQNRTRSISLADIQKIRLLEHLFLQRIRIKLADGEVIQVASFKPGHHERLYELWSAIYQELNQEGNQDVFETDVKFLTFVRTNPATILGILFMMIYINLAVNLDEAGLIYSWNPIIRFYFWTIPLVVFAELLHTP